jgi:hypothetical protein
VLAAPSGRNPEWRTGLVAARANERGRSFDTRARALGARRAYAADVLYPRVVEVVRASRAGSPPAASAQHDATAAVIRARARLEAARYQRPPARRTV